MPNTFGFGTDTTGFDHTTVVNIQKKVIDTLRAGLISLPKGAVVPANLLSGDGKTFTLRAVEYPDLVDSATTAPLSEGVPPTASKLGIDYNDWTVEQVGAYTKVTDLAIFQSPHNLRAIATDKIARLAAQTIDNLGLAAISAHGTDKVAGVVLSTKIVLDAASELESRNVQPISGVGYYALTHPKALRGLKGEASLNGYVDVTAETGSGLTAGAVGQYRGVTFLVSSRIAADASGLYPVIFMGASSMSFGDISTVEYFATGAADSANPLAQFDTAGFKGILGGRVLDFKETADGAGSNGSAVPRIYVVTVSDGTGS